MAPARRARGQVFRLRRNGRSRRTQARALRRQPFLAAERPGAAHAKKAPDPLRRGHPSPDDVRAATGGAGRMPSCCYYLSGWPCVPRNLSILKAEIMPPGTSVPRGPRTAGRKTWGPQEGERDDEWTKGHQRGGGSLLVRRVFIICLPLLTMCKNVILVNAILD